MPWYWDYPNYTFENADMYGYFYPEDIATIRQIQVMEAKRERREYEDAQRANKK